MTQKKIAIVGAGFSGLSLAWQLSKLDFQVEVFEKQARAGGLIESLQGPVLVEKAAHAFLSSREVEELFLELQIPMVQAGHKSRSKWIFREKARRWTLSVWATLQFVVKIFINKFRNRLWPESRQTLDSWARQKGNAELSDYMLSPAMQGIYGTQIQDLSASLIMGGLLSKSLRPGKGSFRGSVAPSQGMQEFTEKCVQALQERGVKFHYSAEKTLSDLQAEFDSVVLATSARSASGILKDAAPELSGRLAGIPAVSLTAVTVASKSPTSRIQGFGCLFPEKEKFHSLGVLFNTDLFENRGGMNSETWIFKNDFANVPDSEILEQIKADRKRLCDEKFEIDYHQIVRWPQALPLYGLQLEELLETSLFSISSSDLKIPALRVAEQGARVRESAKPLYLTGNYLGVIGLTKILNYNQRLARRIQNEVGDAK